MINHEVVVGNSSKRWLVGAFDIDNQPMPLTGCTCKIAVVDYESDETVIAPRDATELHSDGLRFVVQLTKAETSQLTPGRVYMLVSEMTNDSLFFDKEVKTYFKALKGYID